MPRRKTICRRGSEAYSALVICNGVTLPRPGMGTSKLHLERLSPMVLEGPMRADLRDRVETGD